MPHVTYDDLESQFGLLKRHPGKFLELANEFLTENPDHAGGCFSRHFVWQRFKRAAGENSQEAQLVLRILEQSRR